MHNLFGTVQIGRDVRMKIGDGASQGVRGCLTMMKQWTSVAAPLVIAVVFAVSFAACVGFSSTPYAKRFGIETAEQADEYLLCYQGALMLQEHNTKLAGPLYFSRCSHWANVMDSSMFVARPERLTVEQTKREYMAERSRIYGRPVALNRKPSIMCTTAGDGTSSTMICQ